MFMIRPFFRESVILVLFYSVLITGENILENYRPAPGLPEELNGWLASVQRHKDDFALIRHAVQKYGRYDMPINNERKREFRPKYLVNLDDDEDEGYSEERPENDIYPYMYRRRMMEPLAGIVETPSNTRKLRLRRDSAEANKLFNKNNIRLNLQAENGEILRYADKYPGRYKNDNGKDVYKRDVHVDIYSDGKLIKQTNIQDSKSIVLDIQPSEESFMNNQFMPTSEAKRAMYDSKFSKPLPRSAGKILSANPKEEVNNNFKNLFLENEHLNTDTSIHYQNPIIYHVSLPDINSYLKSATTEEINSLEVPNQNNMKNHFNQNGLEDMSPYWSQTEKNIMQKGLEVAQKIVNIPTKMTQASFDKNGFEKIESIVVDDSEESSKSNDKRQLKNRNYYNRNDWINPISSVNDQFDPKSLKKQIADSSQIIRSHYKYGTQNSENFDSIDKKIGINGKDGRTEKDQNNPNNFDEKNKGDDQFILDVSSNEVLPLTQKDLDTISNIGNMPVDVDKVIENQRQMSNRYNYQDNGNDLKIENKKIEPKQRIDDNEISIGNQHSPNTFEEYDHPNVEVRFDSPTHNSENEFVPNNFIGVGKKRPITNQRLDNYSRKRRRDFVLTNDQQEKDRLSNHSNEQVESNLKTLDESQYDTLPLIDIKNENIEYVIPDHELTKEQKDRISDSTIPNLLEAENIFLNSTKESIVGENIFSHLEEQEAKENIKEFHPKKKHKQWNGIEANNSDAQIDTFDIGMENTGEHFGRSTYKASVFIVINARTPEQGADKDEDEKETNDSELTTKQFEMTDKHLTIDKLQEEFPTTVSTTLKRFEEEKEDSFLTSKTGRPFNLYDNKRNQKKTHQNYAETHHLPLKKIEKIKEHIETNRVVTKIESFTIENVSCTPTHVLEYFTEYPVHQPLVNKISVPKNEVTNEAKPNLFNHRRIANNMFPRKKIQIHSLTEDGELSSESNGLNRLRKRKHHIERKRKRKKHSKTNWNSGGIRDYLKHEDQFIDIPNNSDSIPTFVGRRLNSVCEIENVYLRYSKLEKLSTEKRIGDDFKNEKGFMVYPSRDSDAISAYKGRQLNSKDYIYDADLGYPDIDDVINDEKSEELNNAPKRKGDKKKLSTIGSVLHKDSAKDDYGEVDESDNEKETINNVKPIKKTKNKFAHPIFQSTESGEDNQEAEQFNLDVSPKQVQPVIQKDFDANVNNIPLYIDKTIENQIYDKDSNQRNSIHLTNKNNNIKSQQRNYNKEISTDSRHSSNTYGDYDHANAEIQFDSPTDDNEDEYVPNNFIKDANKQPINNPQLDNYNGRKSDFVLDAISHESEVSEFLRRPNDLPASNIDTQIEYHCDNFPPFDMKKQDLNDLTLVHRPIEKHQNRQKDAIPDLLDTDYDSIPAFIGRQLKSQDYIYDVDLGYPDLDDVVNKKNSKELYNFQKRKSDKKISSTIRSVLHKDSAEGDYGEEEESDNTKEKINNSKPIKKTKNQFAHPLPQSTESDEDYYDGDYEQESTSKNSDNKITSDKLENTKAMKETTEKLHRQSHPKPQQRDKQKMNKPLWKKKEKKPKNIKKKTKSIWKRDGENENLVSNSKVLGNSEFQQWPTFLRKDQENEELLRKRSLATTSQSTKTNTFPLSTSSFFVTSQKSKRSTANENADKSLDNKAAFVGDEDKHAITLGINSTQSETVNLPDVSLNLDSDAKLLDTMLPLSASTGTTMAVLGQDITLFTNSEINTTNLCTESLHEVISHACEDQQNFFNLTQIPITSILPMFSEIDNVNGESYEPFEKLDQIITGEIPFKLIDDMFAQLKSKKLQHLRKGLKKTYSKESLNNILDTSNIDSKKVITEMSNLLNKLQISTNCQSLHPRLMHYLKLITKVKSDTVLRKAKEMEGKSLDENQNLNRKNFVFSSGELGDNLEDKAGVLKDLLQKYQNLPEHCKPKALPLKEYIERHLGMLNNILAENDNNNNNDKAIQGDEDTNKSSDQNSGLDRPVKHRSLDKGSTELAMSSVDREKALIEEQLDDLGLGKSQRFKPNFDLNDLMDQQRPKKDIIGRGGPLDYSKRTNTKRLLKRHSESYEKLLNAIAKEKMRKIRETRLGQMYGRFDDDLFNYNEKYKQDATGFEAPLVYSF